MAARESAELAAKRWKDLEALQEHYSEFTDFLYDGITELMGFNCTAVQLDIARFMEYEPNPYKQVQAQRSQAKTTIAAFFVVYCIIHNPTFRALILSAASGMASEISGWVIQIVNGWDILECLRPDMAAGDRSSTEKFDIHHSLKGPEKSPSVACLGIGSSIQGRRADLVIADDVESSKNASTAVQREKLQGQMNDFPSICQSGSILYLGTPQTGESVYNALPGKGFTVRIWPGRYPTELEEPGYGPHLAPMIRAAMQEDPTLRNGGGPAMNRGKPTDPELLDEASLTQKEIAQGTAYFQLQHMLCTELSDKERFPLKARDLMFYPLNTDDAPAKFRHVPLPENALPRAVGGAIEETFYRAHADTNGEHFAYQHKIMYVDPAGGGENGDETAYVILYIGHGYTFLMHHGAVKGGYGVDSFETLTREYEKWDVQEVYVEKNYGHGALAAMWQQHRSAEIAEELRAMNANEIPLLPSEARKRHLAIIDDQVHGQKERRICDTLEPVIGNHKLIINENLIQHDVDLCKDYPSQHKSVFQMFFQIIKITRDKDSLIHDDRVDALAGAVAMSTEMLAVSSAVTSGKVAADRHSQMMLDPLGNGRDIFNRARGVSRNNVLHRVKRPF